MRPVLSMRMIKYTTLYIEKLIYMMNILAFVYFIFGF